jgi:OFA family oxalate/formate antiporter-like MFS transporter
VAAATVLNLPLGSLYAYSVFLAPLEALLGLGRTELAAVFGLAAAGFGLGMNLAPQVYGLAGSPALVLGSAAVSAAGVALAATAGGLAQLALGYGLLFGVGGGAGYILVQQAVNLAVRRRQGLVNGYLVGLYPAGAMLAAPVFGWAIDAVGVRATLGGLAAVLAATGALSAGLIARSGVRLGTGAAGVVPAGPERRPAVFWRLSIVFFLAASAGLMVLSQAAGIIRAYGGPPALAVYGTTYIAGGIAAARLAGGWMVDRLTVPAVAASAHVLALAGNLALSAWPGPRVAVAALALVGLGYGLISGATAAAVAVYWRRAFYGLMASRVYLAWCAAAIVLPVVAGWLFDRTRGYGAAVAIAACGNALGILAALGLPRERAGAGGGPRPPRPGAAAGPCYTAAAPRASRPRRLGAGSFGPPKGRSA